MPACPFVPPPSGGLCCCCCQLLHELGGYAAVSSTPADGRLVVGWHSNNCDICRICYDANFFASWSKAAGMQPIARRFRNQNADNRYGKCRN